MELALLGLFVLSITGNIEIPDKTPEAEYCEVYYPPITTSDEDTKETIKQVTDKNVAYRKLCMK